MIKFGFSQMVVKDNNLIFIDNRTGLIGSMNLETYQVTYWDKQIEVLVNRVDSIVFIGLVENNLYIVTTDGKYIIEYNLEKSEYNTYDLNCNFRDWGNIATVKLYNNNIYVFLRERPYYVCFSIFDKSFKNIKYISKFDGAIKTFSDEKEILVFQSNSFKYIIIDLERQEMKYLDVSQKFTDFICGASDRGFYYIASKNGEIYRINRQNKDVNLFAREYRDISMIVVIGNSLYSFPYDLGEINRYDLSERGVTSVIDYPDDFVYDKSLKWSRYSACVRAKDKYLVDIRNANYLLAIYENGKRYEWITPQILNNGYRIRFRGNDINVIIQEREGDIEDFIDYVRRL